MPQYCLNCGKKGQRNHVVNEATTDYKRHSTFPSTSTSTATLTVDINDNETKFVLRPKRGKSSEWVSSEVAPPKSSKTKYPGLILDNKMIGMGTSLNFSKNKFHAL